VAVGTPDLTLSDLLFDCPPGRVVQQVADVAAFLRAIPVIEFEHQQISFTAVDTRMGC
jgi:hypothetical protein